MSEMLDYDFEAEEADEIAEEDLTYLNDVSCNLDLVVRLMGALFDEIGRFERILHDCCKGRPRIFRFLRKRFAAG